MSKIEKYTNHIRFIKRIKELYGNEQLYTTSQTPVGHERLYNSYEEQKLLGDWDWAKNEGEIVIM